MKAPPAPPAPPPKRLDDPLELDGFVGVACAPVEVPAPLCAGVEPNSDVCFSLDCAPPPKRLDAGADDSCAPEEGFPNSVGGADDACGVEEEAPAKRLLGGCAADAVVV